MGTLGLVQDDQDAGSDPQAGPRAGPRAGWNVPKDEPIADEVDALVPLWRRGLPAGLVTQLEVGKRVARLNQMLEQTVKAELAEIGVSYAEYDVLAALHRIGPPHRLRPSELTRSLWLTSGGTSNLLHRLERDGYIERLLNERDARSRFVQLTEDGERVAARAMQASVRAYDQVCGHVDDQVLRRAADALRDVLVATRRPR